MMANIQEDSIAIAVLTEFVMFANMRFISLKFENVQKVATPTATYLVISVYDKHNTSALKPLLSFLSNHYYHITIVSVVKDICDKNVHYQSSNS